MSRNKSPRLRFAGFAGAWEEKTLGEVFSVRNESVNSDLYDLDVELENLISDLGILIGDTSVRTQTTSFFKTGDILFGRLRPYLNKWWLAEKSGVKSGEIWALETNSSHSNLFAYLIVQSKKFLEKANVTSGTKMPRADWRNLEKLAFNFPTKPEQTALGNFFKRLDETLAQERARLAKTQQLKRAMLAKLFPAQGETAPKLRFKGFSGDWERKMLGEIGNTFGGLTNKSREDFGHGAARYITYLNVYQNAISSATQLDSIEIDDKQNAVKKGDVLFTTSSETPEEVGMSSVWTFDMENVYLNSFCFGYRLNEPLDSNYLAYCLRSDYVRSQMILLAQGISRYNISKKGVMEIEILIPTPEEQTAIGNFFQKLDQTLALQSAALGKLTRLKKALLAAMLV